MSHKQYFKVLDPAVFCPINDYVDTNNPILLGEACTVGGYIPNPILEEDGWVLLMSFQTNSGNTTTFDPVITASSGTYAWDLGDGTICLNDKSISHTYADSSTKTVKLYGKGTCSITSIAMDSDGIIGTLDLSNDAFKPLTSIALYSNASLTSVVFPSVSTGTISALNIYSCNITGVFDLSIFTSFSSSADIQLYSNPAMTGVTFASSVTGTIRQLYIMSCNITGSLNLSMFTAFTATASIQLQTNPSMTGITWASTITGTLSRLDVSNCGITGTFDLSKFSSFTTSAILNLASNVSMTGVTWASIITGTLSTLDIHNTGITGTLDLSKFSSFTTSAAIYLNTNPSMTGITWASTITGTFVTFHIYNTGIIGTLDLSKFSAFSTSAAIWLYSNPAMTGVTFASSITGTISQLYLQDCNIAGTLDLSKFTTFLASGATLDIRNNTAMTAISFKSTTITGFIKTLTITGCTSLGYVDLSKLPTGIASLNWQIQNNGWSAAIVNQILSVVNGISASGFSGRSINIGGTNTDPDTTSGGFDGVAARNALISKSFSVSIT